MKWLFRVIFLVFLLFISLMGLGYISSATITVERSILIGAEADDVFPYLNDLSKYELWSPLHAQIGDAEIFYGGAPNGVGQTSVWKSPESAYPFGTQEIVASQFPEFVQLDVSLAGRPASSFYGLSEETGNGGVIVLMDTEYNLGGFPYIQRLLAKRQIPQAEQAFDEALLRLKTVAEQDVENRLE